MPTLRDTELDVALFLSGLGLGLTYDDNLFAGAIPDESPDPSVLVRLVGSGQTQGYIGSRSILLPAEIQILVRGARNAADEARTLASDIWEALSLASLPGYISVECNSIPASIGPDVGDRVVFLFDASCLYET